ncbi:MAG: hypothetical protein ACHWZW_10225 [Spirulina sp.]
MLFLTTRYRKSASFAHRLSLSGILLVSLLGHSPSVAAAQRTESASVTESDSVLVANIFRQIGDAIRDAGAVIETINTVDSFLQQIGGGNQAPQAAPPAPAPSASSMPVTSPPVPSATAQASDDLQIIHHDNRPTRCHTQGSNPLQCEAFRMTMMPSEGALVFSYYFDNQPFSFVTTTASEFEMGHGLSYRVVGVMYNGETAEKEGTCGVTRIGGQYRAAICSTRDGSIEFTYTNLD